MRVLLATPRGFCAGVDRAILIVDKTLQKFGTPVYVRHEIVHNTHVVNSFSKRGVIFVEEISEIPDGSVVVLSAHGSSPQVIKEARDRHLLIIDAACPLVKKVHNEARYYSEHGYEIILIGHKGHQEVTGTMGYAEMHLVSRKEEVEKLRPRTEKLVYLTQTTLSVDETKDIIDALKAKFPSIIGPKDICYATTNRQKAVKEIAPRCDAFIVVGSKHSSNSSRLKETAARFCTAYLVDSAHELPILQGETIGVSSGASVPDELVQDVLNVLKEQYHAKVEEVVVDKETIEFMLPKELRAVTD